MGNLKLFIPFIGYYWIFKDPDQRSKVLPLAVIWQSILLAFTVVYLTIYFLDGAIV